MEAANREITALFDETITPKNVYGIWDCTVDSSSVALDGITINSRDLAVHLNGCPCAALLAVTLGVEADLLIRRLSLQNMEKAVIAQEVCTAKLEAYCDECTAVIMQTSRLAGLYPAPRFSPGYGDFAITWQKNILQLLNGARIGLSLTNGYMLVPSKSITAIIGFTKEKKQHLNKCAYCSDTECEFRETA